MKCCATWKASKRLEYLGDRNAEALLGYLLRVKAEAAKSGGFEEEENPYSRMVNGRGSRSTRAGELQKDVEKATGMVLAGTERVYGLPAQRAA